MFADLRQHQANRLGRDCLALGWQHAARSGRFVELVREVGFDEQHRSDFQSREPGRRSAYGLGAVLARGHAAWSSRL